MTSPTTPEPPPNRALNSTHQQTARFPLSEGATNIGDKVNSLRSGLGLWPVGRRS